MRVWTSQLHQVIKFCVTVVAQRFMGKLRIRHVEAKVIPKSNRNAKLYVLVS